MWGEIFLNKKRYLMLQDFSTDSLVCLKGGRERGLSLLAALQVGTEEVYYDDVAVQSLQLLEVRVESRG